MRRAYLKLAHNINIEKFWYRPFPNEFVFNIMPFAAIPKPIPDTQFQNRFPILSLEWIGIDYQALNRWCQNRFYWQIPNTDTPGIRNRESERPNTSWNTPLNATVFTLNICGEVCTRIQLKDDAIALSAMFSNILRCCLLGSLCSSLVLSSTLMSTSSKHRSMNVRTKSSSWLLAAHIASSSYETNHIANGTHTMFRKYAIG